MIGSRLALFSSVVLLALAPGSAHAASDDADVRAWVASLREQVPAEELNSAALVSLAADGEDPLRAVAQRHGLEAPAWLRRRVSEQGASVTLAALGDSLTAGTSSCDGLFCPSNSWVLGDQPTSVRRRLEAGSGRRVSGLLAAVPGVTMAAVPAEAFAVYLASLFGLNVQRMTLLIGHNDPGVCHPDKPGEQERFEADFTLALSILSRVAAQRGAKLFVAGALDPTPLTRYGAVVPHGAAAACAELWASTRRCADVFSRRGDAAHLTAVRERIEDNDAVLRRLTSGREWILYSDALHQASGAGVDDPAVLLSPYDCFHPSRAGQSRLAETAWQGGPGGPGLSAFFPLGPVQPPHALAVFPEPRVQALLVGESDAWGRATSRPE